MNWISTEDGLPAEVGELCIVYDVLLGVRVGTFSRWDGPFEPGDRTPPFAWEDATWLHEGEYEDLDNVTYWMPMPSPPPEDSP